MECAICLTDLCPQTESYLLPACYHCFHHHCIMRWTQQQLSHPIHGTSSPPLCPLCKRPYSAIIYECIGHTFKCHEIEAGKGIFPDCPLPKLLSLSAAQQRRRSIYMRWQESTASTASTPAPLNPKPRSRQARHTPDSPAVSEFLTRELQAILLQEDVELVLQHVLGTMRHVPCSSSGNVGSRLQHTGRKQSNSCKRPRHADPAPGFTEAWVTAVSTAAQLFLQQHANAFAQELFRFMEAGLSLRAYDTAGLEARHGGQAHDGAACQPEGTAERHGPEASQAGTAVSSSSGQQQQDLGPTPNTTEADGPHPDEGPGHSFGLVGED